MLNNDGSVLAVFETMAKAEEETGVPKANISACCSQRLFTAGGYRWAYASPDDEVTQFPVMHACNVEFDKPKLPLTYRYILNHPKRSLEAVAWARDKYSDLDDMLTALTGVDVEVTGCERITVAFVSGFAFTMPEEELTDSFLLKLTRLILACSQLSEDAGDYYRGVYDGEHIVVEKNV